MKSLGGIPERSANSATSGAHGALGTAAVCRKEKRSGHLTLVAAPMAAPRWGNGDSATAARNPERVRAQRARRESFGVFARVWRPPGFLSFASSRREKSFADRNRRRARRGR